MVTSDAEWIKNCLKAVKEAIEIEWSEEVESEHFSTNKDRNTQQVRIKS